MPSASSRLFIALELPEADRRTLAALDPELNGLRWLPEAQIHLTLSFLGDVRITTVEKLHESSLHRPRPAFLPAGAKPRLLQRRGPPSVVWAGIGKGHPHLFALHKHIQDAGPLRPVSSRT